MADFKTPHTFVCAAIAMAYPGHDFALIIVKPDGQCMTLTNMPPREASALVTAVAESGPPQDIDNFRVEVPGHG